MADNLRACRQCPSLGARNINSILTFCVVEPELLWGRHGLCSSLDVVFDPRHPTQFSSQLFRDANRKVHVGSQLNAIWQSCRPCLAMNLKTAPRISSDCVTGQKRGDVVFVVALLGGERLNELSLLV